MKIIQTPRLLAQCEAVQKGQPGFAALNETAEACAVPALHLPSCLPPLLSPAFLPPRQEVPMRMGKLPTSTSPSHSLFPREPDLKK